MNKGFKSISWKIFSSMAGTLLILVALVLVANFTVLEKIKNEYIFNQLSESATAKKNYDDSALLDEDDATWIAHFKIAIDGDKTKLYMDKFASAFYKDQDELVETIVQNIVENPNEIKGYITDDIKRHYYYVAWGHDHKTAMIFTTTVKTKQNMSPEIFLMILLLLIVSFIASKFAASRIAKPIQNLEQFAEEISKKNWQAIAPKTDNDEIGLLAIALTDMKDALKEAEEKERHFLQATSHDLKTPVMIIKGYAQALIDGVSIDSKISSAEIIKSESERLERKITQLLRFNTLSYTLELSSKDIIRMDKLLNSLVKKFRVISPDLQWELNLKEVEVVGDSDSLLIALENILENQLRFARHKITITLEKKEGCQISISNDGPNFETEDPNTLFDIHKKDLQGNFGLGLAIVKQVISAHHGSVEASNLEHGILFTIKL